MKVVYNSKLGKTKEFALKVSPYSVSTEDYKETDEDILLITYTIGVGDIPAQVKKFIDKYSNKIKAVVSTGNKEKHPDTFCFACDKISKMLNIPCVRKVQLKGDNEDVLTVIGFLNENKNEQKINEECTCPNICNLHVECSCAD